MLKLKKKMNRIQQSILIVVLCFCSYTSGQSSQKFKVALDAGHGDHDYGAVYNGHIEKNIALAVVLKVGKILEKNSNIDVIYTRKTDVFIGLVERANIANRADANIFVSIHCNANKNTAATGTETYVLGMSKASSNLEAANKENEVVILEKDYIQKYGGYDPKATESISKLKIIQEEFLESSVALAGKIQNHFIDDLGKKSRGVKQAPFLVLHKVYMPRVLVKMGFISNPAEGEILDSEKGQDEIAESIANAIISYKKEVFGPGDNESGLKPSQKMDPAALVDSSTVVTKSKKIDTKTKPVSNAASLSGIVFKVQLAASGKKLDLVPSNFNGLSNISMSSNGSINKYMYGDTSNYDEAKKLLSEAKAKGYATAYVVAFKDGKVVSVQEALK